MINVLLHQNKKNKIIFNKSKKNNKRIITNKLTNNKYKNNKKTFKYKIMKNKKKKNKSNKMN